MYKCKWSKDINIQYIGYTLRPLIERVKKDWKGKTALFDHVSFVIFVKTKELLLTILVF